MLGFKRQAFDACPERSQSKVSKDDASSIYESTLHKMFLGERLDRRSRLTSAASESRLTSPVVATFEGGNVCEAAGSVKCDLGEATASAGELAVRLIDSGSERVVSISTQKSCCLMRNDNYACFHCRRKICILCLKHCTACQEDFCTTCALSDFTERYDRAFCLDCHDSTQKRSDHLEYEKV